MLPPAPPSCTPHADSSNPTGRTHKVRHSAALFGDQVGMVDAQWTMFGGTGIAGGQLEEHGTLLRKTSPGGKNFATTAAGEWHGFGIYAFKVVKSPDGGGDSFVGLCIKRNGMPDHELTSYDAWGFELDDGHFKQVNSSCGTSTGLAAKGTICRLYHARKRRVKSGSIILMDVQAGMLQFYVAAAGQDSKYAKWSPVQWEYDFSQQSIRPWAGLDGKGMAIKLLGYYPGESISSPCTPDEHVIAAAIDGKRTSVLPTPATVSQATTSLEPVQPPKKKSKLELWNNPLNAGETIPGASSHAIDQVVETRLAELEHELNLEKQRLAELQQKLGIERLARQRAEEQLAGLQAEEQLAGLHMTSCPLGPSIFPLIRLSKCFMAPPGCSVRVNELWNAGNASPSFEAKMLLSMWAEGSRGRVRNMNPLLIAGSFPELNRSPVNGFRLTRIEAVDVTQIPQNSRASKEERFNDQINDFERNRTSQPDNPALNPEYSDPDGEKAAVLNRLKARFFSIRSLVRQNLMIVFHGTDHATAESVCLNGFEQLNYRDQGWFGQGFYATTYAEYACLYATGQLKAQPNPTNSKGEYVVLACWATPGMCYPISRVVDYTFPQRQHSTSIFCDDAKGRPLKGQFQSHYAMIEGLHYQCMDGVRRKKEPDYDEIVFRNPSQLLPAYRLYFVAEA